MKFINYALYLSQIENTAMELPNLKGYYNPFTRYEKGKFYKINDFIYEVKLFMKRRGKVPDLSFKNDCVQIFNDFNSKLT